jgi:putative tryptophan/tyrosine transport system substrate-binding protein
MAIGIGRRRFVGTLSGMAVAWPLAARAQQPERVRHIGMLMSTDETDPRERASVAAFVEALRNLGQVVGRNIEIVYRWGAGDPQLMAANARELISQVPDVIVLKGANLPAAREMTATIPIVFMALSDVSVQEFVGNFAHPVGNITGFASDELALVGKRLGLLREMNPRTARVLYLTSKRVGVGRADLSEQIRKDAAAVGVVVTNGAADSAAEIEAIVQEFAREPDGGLVVAFNAFTTVHRQAIAALATRHRLPAIYPLRSFTDGGGLFSYGFDQDDQFKKAADYVDRILKGAKPGDLPVQLPTKYQMIINLKAAKALGLRVSAELLARADEVFE